MKKNILILLIIIGCSPLEQPMPSSPNPIWKTKFIGDIIATSFYPPVIHDDKVIISRFPIPYDSKIMASDKNTGEMLWEWDDFFHDWETGSSFKGYQYENLWIFSTGPRVYAINLDNGETVWKTHAPESGDVRLKGIGRKVFHMQISGDINQANRVNKLFVSDVQKGNWKEVFSLLQTDSLQPSFSYDFLIDVNLKGDTLIWFNDIMHNYSQNISYNLKVFNLRLDSFVVDRELTDLKASQMPVVIGDNIIFGGLQIVCYDRNTYKVKWVNRTIHGDPFAFDGMLFINEETGIPAHHLRLDPDTGDEIWKTQTSGSSSDLVFKENRLFFIGGGDGKLHGLHAETGEYFWHFEAPELKENSNLWFDRSISIDQETGRIYTCDFKNIICYPPPN